MPRNNTNRENFFRELTRFPLRTGTNLPRTELIFSRYIVKDELGKIRWENVKKNEVESLDFNISTVFHPFNYSKLLIYFDLEVYKDKQFENHKILPVQVNDFYDDEKLQFYLRDIIMSCYTYRERGRRFRKNKKNNRGTFNQIRHRRAIISDDHIKLYIYVETNVDDTKYVLGDCKFIVSSIVLSVLNQFYGPNWHDSRHGIPYPMVYEAMKLKIIPFSMKRNIELETVMETFKNDGYTILYGKNGPSNTWTWIKKITFIMESIRIYGALFFW